MKAFVIVEVNDGMGSIHASADATFPLTHGRFAAHVDTGCEASPATQFVSPRVNSRMIRVLLPPATQFSNRMGRYGSGQFLFGNGGYVSALKNVEGSASQVNQEILARMCRRSAIDHSPLATLGTLPQCIRLTTPIN